MTIQQIFSGGNNKVLTWNLYDTVLPNKVTLNWIAQLEVNVMRGDNIGSDLKGIIPKLSIKEFYFLENN